MLNQTADHAIRALLALARYGDGGPMRVEELAERTGAPRNYLGKTLNGLVKGGYLRSARGPLGGFALAASPDAITIGEIADLFTEARAPRRCLLGNGLCDASRPCGAHGRWIAMATAARAPLDNTTLADLLADDADAPLLAAIGAASHAGSF